MVWNFFKQKQAAPPPTRCTTDFELADNRHAVMALLQRTIPTLTDEGNDLRVFDFSACQYLGPFAAAIIYANLLEAKAQGKQVELVVPNTPKVQAFLTFSGFNHLVFGRPKPKVDHPDNVTVPLHQAHSNTLDVADPVIELVNRYAVLTSDDEEYLRNAVGEVIQNVEDHAKSRVGAICCGRYLTGKAKVRVAIVDRGDGIASTLRRAHPEVKTTEEALRRVIKGGISAKSRQNNMGLGVSNLWGQVINPLNGEIFIVSDDALAYSDGGRNTRVTLLPIRFPGTGVFFTVPVADKKTVQE